jgi:hypothetical protein
MSSYRGGLWNRIFFAILSVRGGKAVEAVALPHERKIYANLLSTNKFSKIQRKGQV